MADQWYTYAYKLSCKACVCCKCGHTYDARVHCKWSTCTPHYVLLKKLILIPVSTTDTTKSTWTYHGGLMTPHSVMCLGQLWLGAIVCRLFGVNPSAEPMLAYYQLDHWDQMPVIFIDIWKCSSNEIHLKMSYAKWRPFFFHTSMYLIFRYHGR